MPSEGMIGPMKRKQKNRIVKCLAAALPASLVAMVILQQRQVSPSDPYHAFEITLWIVGLAFFFGSFLALAITRACWRKSLSPVLVDMTEFLTTIAAVICLLFAVPIVGIVFLSSPLAWMLLVLGLVLFFSYAMPRFSSR